MNFKMTETGYTLTTGFGEVAISGDETKGFKPGELLIASIAICSAGVLRQVLNKMRMPAEDVHIDLKEVERVPEEASRIKKIHFHLTVKGEGITEEKLAKAIELSTKNCAMVQTVKDAIEIEKTFTLVG